jgi:hypothetical protein
MARRVRWLLIGAVLICWAAAAPTSTPSTVQAHALHSVAAAPTASVIVDNDPQHSGDAGALTGLTSYVVGLGLVLTMIALLGLRACERQAGGHSFRRQRRLSKR